MKFEHIFSSFLITDTLDIDNNELNKHLYKCFNSDSDLFGQINLAHHRNALVENLVSKIHNKLKDAYSKIGLNSNYNLNISNFLLCQHNVWK